MKSHAVGWGFRGRSPGHSGDSDTLTFWHLTFGCFGDDVTPRCNWQSVIPQGSRPRLLRRLGSWAGLRHLVHLGGQVASRLPSSNTSLPCPVPVSKGQGGRSAMFRLFIQDERRVTNSRTSTCRAHHHHRKHQHHAAPMSPQNTIAEPMPMPMPMQRNVGAGHQLSPDLRKPPLLFFVYICSRPGALLSDFYDVPRLTQP